MFEIKPKRSKGRIIVAVLITFIVLFEVASFIGDRMILQQTYQRSTLMLPFMPSFDDYANRYTREPVEFEMDGQTLRGYVYGPQNTRGLIIFRHGFSSQHKDYLPMITAMVDKGWKIFAYDAIGCGESDGDNIIGFAQSPLDVAAAVQFAQESGMADGMKIGLWGHSWGGYGVAGALDLVDVDACVTMSGFDTPMKILGYGAEAAVGPLAFTQTPTLWLNNMLAFGGDANRSASKAILESGTPTFILHGLNDETVPYDNVSIMANTLSDSSSPFGVSTRTFAEPGRSGHNDYFYSRESQAYLDECATELQRLLDENDGVPTAPEVTAYVETIDKLRANTADPELIGEIDRFFANYLTK